MDSGIRLTYDAEGTDEQCQYPHVPTSTSGLTLGHGYDCWLKSPSKILGDLLGAGIPPKVAYHFSHASGLRGRLAREWLENSEYNCFAMTPEQQGKLFAVSYAEMAESAMLLYSKPDCREEYGWVLAWDGLLEPIRRVIIDLRYRGDWTPETRAFLASAVKSNDMVLFTRAMKNEKFWLDHRRVPIDRFRRRVAYLVHVK